MSDPKDTVDVPDVMVIPRLDTLNGGNKKLYFIAMSTAIFAKLAELGFKLDDELKYFYSTPLPPEAVGEVVISDDTDGMKARQAAAALMEKMNEHFEKLTSAGLYIGFYQKQSEIPESMT